MQAQHVLEQPVAGETAPNAPLESTQPASADDDASASIEPGVDELAHAIYLGEQLWQDDDARGDALEDLAATGHDSAADALGYLLSHHDADVREDAVDALVDLGTHGVEEHLHRAAQDSHPVVRLAAQEGLEELRLAP